MGLYSGYFTDDEAKPSSRHFHLMHVLDGGKLELITTGNLEEILPNSTTKTIEFVLNDGNKFEGKTKGLFAFEFELEDLTLVNEQYSADFLLCLKNKTLKQAEEIGIYPIFQQNKLQSGEGVILDVTKIGRKKEEAFSVVFFVDNHYVGPFFVQEQDGISYIQPLGDLEENLIKGIPMREALGIFQDPIHSESSAFCIHFDESKTVPVEIKNETFLKLLKQSQQKLGIVAEMKQHNQEATVESVQVDKKQEEVEEMVEMSQSNDTKNRDDLKNEIYQLEVEKGVIAKEVSQLKEQQEQLRSAKEALENEERLIEARIQTYIDKQKGQMVDIAFNGLVANKLITAAANWQIEEIEKNEDKVFQQFNELKGSELTGADLVLYLCEMVKDLRPSYQEYDIVNMAICMVQGFITVFSGEPGSGKTSICNIFAEIFGLNTFNKKLNNPDFDMNRYIPISVERGWTSKRDFIGYFNPLTKTFDQSNGKMFHALKTLDREKREGIKNFPLFVLLDEANLSPMEYYWADFMNVCDKIEENSCVNLSENHIYGIPETLRFLATINNDHTTEILSPRLIDRSWVIRLPRNQGEILPKELDVSKLKRISWQSIEETFLPKEVSPMVENAKAVYKRILDRFEKERVRFSPRTTIAVNRYIAVAAPIYQSIGGHTREFSAIIALDYAVAQRILPKIMGSGDDFRVMLEDIKVICQQGQLPESEAILGEILENGNNQMKYYRYF